MKSFRTIFGSIMLTLAFLMPSFAQKSSKDSTKLHIGPLFKSDSMLAFTLNTNLKVLLKDRGDNPINHWASLEYKNESQEAVSLNLKVKVRGNFRKSSSNCVFPPMLLNLPDKKTKNTVFEHQDHLKLVTHCQSEDYIFQEYLVYKAYNLLTDYSFKARLAKVTYQDSTGKRDPQTRLAFLLEEEDMLAKRNATEIFKLKNISMNQVDSVQMATAAVFEYMIGNTDWSVPYLHNIKLLFKKGSPYLPVPYDFDHSGIVEAKYAQPAQELEISSVRRRLYRGITFTPTVFQEVFANFKRIKPQLYALYEGNPQLNERYIKRTIKYLDEFYETIDDPKSLKKIFIHGGGQGASKGVVIKGLN